jgi:hypothetical protein
MTISLYNIMKNLKVIIPCYLPIFISTSQNNALTANILYFDNQDRSAVLTETGRELTIPITGIIKIATILCNAAGVYGSAEPFSLYIRINHTTDYLINTVALPDAKRHFNNYLLNIPVSQGDLLTMKLVPPVPLWITHPQATTFSGNLIIEY